MQPFRHPDLHQELGTLARLHVSIRSGNATLQDGVMLDGSSVSSTATVFTSQLSPCGSAAVLTWVDSAPDGAEEENVWGHIAACRANDTSEWALYPQGWGPADPTRCSGWAPSGLQFVSLHRRGAGAEARVSVCMFRRNEACWSQELGLSGSASSLDWEEQGDLLWDPSEKLCAASVVDPVAGSGSILIFCLERLQMQALFVDNLRYLHLFPFTWLPDGCGLAIAKHKGPALAVAHLASSASSQAEPFQVHWTAVGVVNASTVNRSLTVLPSGHILVLHVTLEDVDEGPASLCDVAQFSVYGPSAMRQRSASTHSLGCSQSFSQVPDSEVSVTINASQVAAILTFAYARSYVFQMNGDTVGPLLWAAKSFHVGLSVSPAGHFLACVRDHGRQIEVLDRATGNSLMQVTPDGTWAGLFAEQCLGWRSLEVAWSGRRCNQLHVTAFCKPAGNEDAAQEVAVFAVYGF